MKSSSQRQAAHYDRILNAYDEHYYDSNSLKYREEFILLPMLKGLDLAGKRVADLACGSGQTSLYLMQKFPGIQLEGFDISPEVCERYRRSVHRPCSITDLTKPVTVGERFDAAIIMGGLHHCISDLPQSLENISNLLKPGGLLLMFEPSKNFGLESLRKLWYKLDTYFDAETEAALSHDELYRSAPKDTFKVRSVRYFGGPAFFIVYNSLVFRIPLGVKRVIAPPILALEKAYGKLPGKFWYSSFIAQWEKI